MDRAATRHKSQTRLALGDGEVTPCPRAPSDVTWRGDERVVHELYDRGFLSLCSLSPQPSALGPRDRADQLVASGVPDGVTIVKSGPHRSVYRIELSSGIVFLKHFKTSHAWEILRNTLRGTPAAREAHAAQAVAAANIETMTCVAVGCQSRGPLARDSFLASSAIENVIPLDSLARDPARASLRTPAFRRELARALGRLCGRLHRAGLVHRDLHPGNLLVEVTDAAAGMIVPLPIRLKLIDLQGVRPRRNWGVVFRRGARARWDLFGLFNFFQMAGRADRWRFLDAYLSEVHTDSPATLVSDPSAIGRAEHCSRRKLATQIEAFCRNALRREQLRYDKKWQRSNRRLIVADSPGIRCRSLAILGTDQVLELRANPDTLFRPDRVRLWLRRTNSVRAAVIDLWAAGTAVRCEVRETTRPLGWRDLLPRLGWSATRRAWEMTHALRRRGVSTPRTLLYLETRSVSRVREILVVERSGRSVTPATFLAQQFPGLSPRQQEAWINANARLLAGELARMREFSLVHQRLSAADFLVNVDAGDCSVQIGGADRIVRRRFLPQCSVDRMLGQLEASLSAFPELRLAHRLRFLKKYRGDRFAAEWKSLWRAIATSRPHTNSLNTLGPASGNPLGRTVRAAALLIAVVLAFTGCQAVDRPIGLPVKYEVKCERDQLLVLSNFKLQKDHELIRELTTLREQEAKVLDLPLQRDPVVIYLFNNETEYRKYMAVTYPKLPPRSAYFVGSATELAVYTHWGQSVREDLRHEYTHGLLHSAMKRVPLWLDEGLAEYFEIPGSQPGGINREYATKLSVLLAQGWQPNLKRLENFDDNAQMRRSDYQEAWAWVHFMMHGPPEAKRVLLAYLNDLRTNSDPKPISRRLAKDCPDFQERSMSYMARLAPEKQVADAL
jgi:Lipopolysaccharide kinase (Kdo/WaaP) family